MLPDHPPEVSSGVLEGSLGRHEGIALAVALRCVCVCMCVCVRVQVMYEYACIYQSEL